MGTLDLGKNVQQSTNTTTRLDVLVDPFGGRTFLSFLITTNPYLSHPVLKIKPDSSYVCPEIPHIQQQNRGYQNNVI